MGLEHPLSMPGPGFPQLFSPNENYHILPLARRLITEFYITSLFWEKIDLKYRNFLDFDF